MCNAQNFIKIFMATIQAFIRTNKSQTKPVNVRFRLSDKGGYQLFHKSEISVIPDKWDDKQQKIKARCVIDEQERHRINNAVNDIKKLINEIYTVQGKNLTSELLKYEINKTLKKTISQTFFFFF
jgi:hypothetical protein